MSFEQRAAQAARSLRASVSGVAPVGIPAIVGRQRRSLITTLVATTAAVLLFVGIASAMPSFFEPDQLATDNSIPDGTPIVVEPDDKDSDELVDLDKGDAVLAVRQTASMSDSSEPYTVFYGHGEPGSIVTVTSAYAEADTIIGASGEFELKVWFEPRPPAGVTFPILVMVDGQAYEFTFTSLFDPDNIEITANQVYGASDDAEAYEKFFGTAPPGTEVVATSPYGSADTVAGEKGRWDLKLWFEGPLPLDEPFQITLTVGDETFLFSFVSVFEPGDLPLSITQVNSVSDSKNPYVQFVGTAPAGTHLLAQSEFGGHDIVVGESGEFSLKVWFSPLPPAGQQFPITFKVNHEFHQTYYFTSYYAPSAGDITVTQYNTASDNPEPWVKFYGTAPVGTQIQILSPYGSWSWTTEAYEWNSGHKYFTSLPPAGQQFTITVKVNGETFGTYPFTSHWNPNQIIIEPVVTISDDPDPYAKIEYWAPAGTSIRLTSAYGNSDTIVLGETGGGHLKLWFTSLPPAGVEFPVTVKVNGETHSSFGFTSYYDPAAVEVSVNHAYNSCSLDPPYDDLWGTAPAGTQIKIISSFGSSTFTVGESGNWEKRQYFEGATYGQAFTVTVKVNGETHTTYQFTVYAPD